MRSRTRTRQQVDRTSILFILRHYYRCRRSRRNRQRMRFTFTISMYKRHKIEIQISTVTFAGFATWIRSRDMNLAARDSGRLFRLFIGTIRAKRRRRSPLCPLRPFPPFSGWTPNGSDTLTSMDYFSVRRIIRLPH